ncbi:hypothetical protein JEOAER750_02055 [Jeotgalicoccus aerolatus]|uniref:MFS family permease n=1 Tax=Jeotgalicoccus aerolatus TaxID=709510 RepID=A0A1G8YPI4_9STAP|nr:hypothetical protein [Jeotgalicoccus aerolatus]MBP1952849.1 MFS family permease [Jeotgalicoccus aerolatus]NMA81181.1 hypothetical protein [Jeotgalicoccus aerolatus]CAD2080505.1 hypothetical protein JEOAER750_02055 [Jeotgalicoccus aerolatus]SDK04698.1 hypothetical protein SAMN05216187_104169 [Jeotgalicoccus aerolatus]GGE07556.1 membrane protein [Jeotgalicoccus aerolatus]
MIEEPIVATVMLFALLALGEVISIYSRARIPMLMTAMIGYLVLTWTGVFPENILELSTLPALGAILIGPLIIHMGTLMPLSILKKQWRAVIISVSGLIGALALVLLIVPLFFDFETAASGVGPISGGVVALLITTEKLTELGLTALIVVPVLIAAFQTPIGMPLIAFLLKRYASRFVSTTQATQAEMESMEEDETPVRFNLLKNNIILLFIVFVFAAVATVLSEWTGIHFTLFCLLFGILMLNGRLFPQAVLQKSNSFSFMMVALIFVIIGTMGGITPQDVINNIPAVILILICGVSGLALGGFIASKAVGWHPLKGMPVALTALVGFPGDYIICEEVSRSTTDNQTDQTRVFNEIVTPMLIGGFVTVTVASVVVASFVMGML